MKDSVTSLAVGKLAVAMRRIAARVVTLREKVERLPLITLAVETLVLTAPSRTAVMAVCSGGGVTPLL